MASDLRGLVGTSSPLIASTTVQKPDMLGLQNPISGFPASLFQGFNSIGYPVATRDPLLDAFAPSSISNLVGWFKASDFDSTADGTEVAQWYDHSGLTRGATTIGSVGSRCTVSRNSINGNMTTIRGATSKRGLQTRINSGGIPLTTIATYSWFAVVSFSTLAASENNCLGIKNNNLVIRFGINSTGPGDFNTVYPNVGNFRSTTALTTAFCYIFFVSSANTETVYLNNSALSWLSQPGSPSGDSPQDLFLLDDGNTSAFQGNCAEIGFYDKALSAGERTTLQTYCQQRYGLA